MRRDQRLRSNADFVHARREGRSWSHPLLVLHAVHGGGDQGQSRVGVTVGRWAGGAVERNRARRRVSESVRLRYDEIEGGWDLVFVARTALGRASFADIESAVDSLLRRARLVGSEAPCAGSHSG